MPPKRKLTRPRTRRRFAEYRNGMVKRLENGLRLAPCPLCGSAKLSHHLCATCGGYGRTASAPAAVAPLAKQPKKKPAAAKTGSSSKQGEVQHKHVRSEKHTGNKTVKSPAKEPAKDPVKPDASDSEAS